MPITSPGNDDDTGENHQPTLRKNTAEPVEQTLKQNRLLSYRIGGEAALMGEREGNRKYDYETKLAAVLDHLERGMSRPEVMERYGIASRTCLKQWCQDYRRGGPEALRPKPKGRPKGAKSKPKPAPTREQLLEEENAYLKARVAYLEKARALLAPRPTTGRSR